MATASRSGWAAVGCASTRRNAAGRGGARRTLWGRNWGADFAPDGRLATTSYDGKVRLYPPGIADTGRPALTVAAPGGERPLGIAFRPPDGAYLAIGYDDVGRVDVLDAHSLAALAAPEITGIDAAPSLARVAWSHDGEELLAGGMYFRPGGPVLAWSQGGTGPRRLLVETKDTVEDLIGLPNGDLLEAEAVGLSRLEPDGTRRWARELQIADFRGQAGRMTVSADGARVGFGYEPLGGSPAKFDMATRALVLGPRADDGMAAPRQTGLNIDRWEGYYCPTLDGKALGLKPHDISRSLAIHPSGKSFVLGTSWFLSAYDAQGAPLWSHPARGEAWGVNIAGDGRLVVGAYGDGTIRWHRMTDGAELLAFMPLADHTNWVAWTPEGFYAATAGAQGVLRWHVNRGWDSGRQCAH